MAEIPNQVKDAAQIADRRLKGLKDGAQSAVREHLDKAIIRLENELQELDPSSFRAQQARIQHVILAATEQSITSTSKAAELASEWAGYDVAAETNEWFDHYGSEARVPNMAAIAEADESVIRRIESSFARWGEAVTRDVEREVAAHIATRGDRTELTDRIQRTIQGRRYQADRIARTELSDAYNTSHRKSLKKMRDSGLSPESQKTAIVTFDIRTDADSFPLDGQVKEIEETFVDGEGRRYLSPPGRPNDREKQVPYVPDVTDAAGDEHPTVAAREETGIEDAPRAGEADISPEQIDSTSPPTPPDGPSEGEVEDFIDAGTDAAERQGIEPRSVEPEIPGKPKGIVDDEIEVDGDTAERDEGLSWPTDLDEVEKVDDLGGSTGAELVRDADGNEFVLKRGNSPGHIENEMRADAAYQSLDVPVPRFRRYEDADGRPVKLAERIDGVDLAEFRREASDEELEEVLDKIREDFAVDATLGNWDVIGAVDDNIIVDEDGIPWRIDNGGALRYRAQGGLKRDQAPEQWNGHITELETMRGDLDEKGDDTFAELGIDEILDPADDYADQREELLEAVGEDAPVVRERFDELQELAEVNEEMRVDSFVEEYRDRFVRQKIKLRNAGVTDFDDVEYRRRVGKESEIRADKDRYDPKPEDASGREFDDIRGRGGGSERFRQYLDRRGLSSSFIRKWGDQQKTDSGKPASEFMRVWWSDKRDVDPDGWFWRRGNKAKTRSGAGDSFFDGADSWPDNAEEYEKAESWLAHLYKSKLSDEKREKLDNAGSYELDKVLENVDERLEGVDKAKLREQVEDFTSDKMDVDAKSEVWRNGEYELDEEKIDETLAAQHAFTHEVLDSAAMKSGKRQIRLYRSVEPTDLETPSGEQMSRAYSKGESDIDLQNGVLESGSVANGSYVYGDAMLRYNSVPQHRVLGSYHQGGADTDLRKTIFMDNDENEVLFDGRGTEKDWILERYDDEVPENAKNDPALGDD